MKLKTKAERLAFILRGRSRREIYNVLRTGPRTKSEITQKTSIQIPNITRIIEEFEDNDLVVNLTPSETRGCLYQLTPIALEFESEFEEHRKFRKKN